MQALVLSDTHFGTWTGHDLLRDQQSLELVAPHLDDVDEVIFLGDLFDLLFSRLHDAFTAAGPFLDLLREKLQGKRLVFVAGNHDHHFVARESEAITELQLATGEPVDALRKRVRDEMFFRRFLQRRLEGVEIELRYPTYLFGDVLCTHGHYLDAHQRQMGSVLSRLLNNAVWTIALGQTDDPRTIEEYEALITLLTEELYTLAQVPHGTAVQRNVYAAAQRIANIVEVVETPLRLARNARRRTRRRQGQNPYTAEPMHADGDLKTSYRRAYQEECQRPHTDGPGGPSSASYPLARTVRPNDPREQAVRAFSKVVHTLGWDKQAGKIVFGHTHQPLDDVTIPGSNVRYWNTGSWIYEPNLASREAYLDYLRRAWPGTAILLDTEADRPRLLRLREHLNPLRAGHNDA